MVKGRLKRLERQALKDGIVLSLRDGTTKVFDDMTCWKEMYLVEWDLFRGEARQWEVLEAVRSATPESRRAFEAKYGSIEMEAQVICPEMDGGWVEVTKLLEGGTIEKVRHEGHTEEAKRLREAARQQGSSFS